MAHSTDKSANVRLEIMSDPKDFGEAITLQGEAFGIQTKDGYWLAMNPGWDNQQGLAILVDRFTGLLKKGTKNKDGQPNSVHLKAVVTDEFTGTDKIVGYAIWTQYSEVDGYGVPVSDIPELEKLYPNNEGEQRYLRSIGRALMSSRKVAIAEKAKETPPAMYICDCCAVLPDYQGRGIARKLIQWGVDEAKERGGLECGLEASVMGRRVYQKMGFVDLGPITRNDGEFPERAFPDTIWMRNGTSFA